jgi:hypothetical protein
MFLFPLERNIPAVCFSEPQNVEQEMMIEEGLNRYALPFYISASMLNLDIVRFLVRYSIFLTQFRFNDEAF